MTDTAIMALDPAALSAFAATLTDLPKDEISKAKKLYNLILFRPVLPYSEGPNLWD